jgi:hypothetical protein
MLRENLSHASAHLKSSATTPWLLKLVPQWLVRRGAGVLLSSLNKTVDVECRFRRLSDVIFREEGLEHIDLLKIDVEGAELDVLRGISDGDWPRIRQITMEVENDALAEAITALLLERGFRVHSWTNRELQKLLPTSQVGHLFATRAVA